MSTQTPETKNPRLMPGIAQAAIFISVTIIYGILAYTAANPLLWGLWALILACALTLAFAVIGYRVKGTPKPRWIAPLGSVAMIAAIVFGSVHSSLNH